MERRFLRDLWINLFSCVSLKKKTRYNLTSPKRLGFFFGPRWDMILYWLWIEAQNCTNYSNRRKVFDSWPQSKLSAANRPCRPRVIIQSQPLAALLHVFQLSLLNALDNIVGVGRNSPTRREMPLTAKRRIGPVPSPPPFLPNFPCRILPLGGFDREALADSAWPVAGAVHTVTSVAQLTLRVSE